ncbi:MAG: isoleucine--tRNA ligase [Candidatus Diapherotrites archaeon]|nr:isoleucine--tRNA ligase [Candidatus Diapherotrites archaeon]
MTKLIQSFSKELEEEIIKFWKNQNIVKKVEQKKGEKKFYMMDGPPYASGHIHMGTALNKILKDVAIRSKRMEGYDVRAQAGYDTHGVPIEIQVEKKMNFKTKKDIEQFGVDNFIKECRNFATRYIDTMNEEFLDLGVWMDYENPYLTLSNEYIEGIWWTFKIADEKGLLYLGNYPVHVCPRCETVVAYNEIEYTKLTDNSIYVKFPVKGQKNKFLIIWTTTPWTLPANTGIMVHPEFEYAEIKLSNSEIWIVAKDRVEALMDVLEAGYSIERTFKGKQIENMEYENPLLKYLNLKKIKGAYRIILSERYVNLEDGSGLVHTAPGHGKEDYDAGTKAGLPILSPVNLDGTMKEEAGKYSGKKAREVDSEIINDLEKDGFLVYKHPYTHDYPVCWRCKSPLLMIALPQWFFAVEKLRNRMMELNEEVKWVPDWGKARFKNWLESLSDWPISRQRYWGTPLPIWICEKCNKRKVIGSIEELKKESNIKEIKDLHKPWVDEILIKCSCGGLMKRVPEVMDVWFDSGVCSWASLNYPKEKELFEKFWPADLNIEGSDQIRGWWNSQMITSTICFNNKPYKAIVMHGMVLDLDKRKMSKSLGNVITPSQVIEKYSRDALRVYLISQSKGEDILFDWKEFKEINRFFNTLINCYNYLAMYEVEQKQTKVLVEDKWIISKLNSLKKEVIGYYNNYLFYKAAAAIDRFVVEELSRNYIKLIRPRVDDEDYSCLVVLRDVLLETLKILAPIAPHITEYIYQELRSSKMPESIHLCEIKEEEKIYPELEEEFEMTKEITQQVLSLREKHNLRLRWILEELVIMTKDGNTLKETKDVLKRFCNVKEVKETTKEPKGNYAKIITPEIAIFLKLDVNKELRDEWEFTELRRRIQALRKEKKLLPKDKVELNIYCSDKIFLEKLSKRIETETNTELKIINQPKEKEKIIEREYYIEIGEKIN